MKKRSNGVTITGITLIFISIMFIYIIHHADVKAYTYGITLKTGMVSLLGWLIPAFLGVGVLYLNNFFRIATICVSALFAFWTPLMYFYSRMIFENAGLELPVFTKYEIIDLFLIIFGICVIYFFTRPQIKRQFMD